MCVCRSIVSQYLKISVWIIAGASFLVMLLMQFLNDTSIFPAISHALLVSVVFSCVASFAYGYSWKAIALNSPNNLAKFYLLGSLCRMMVALMVYVVYAFIIKEKSSVIWFTGVFAGFYILLLIFDCIYFTRTEKQLNIK